MPTSRNTRSPTVVNYSAARRQALDRSALAASLAPEPTTIRIAAKTKGTKKKDEPTTALQIAREACDGRLMGELRGEATGGVVWRWHDGIWSSVIPDRGRQAALDWLERHAPAEYTPKKATDAWSAARDRLTQRGQIRTSTVGRRIIVPTKTAYLEVCGDGRIVALAPDKELGLYHRIDIAPAATPGAEYTPAEIPAASLFGRFLSQAMPDQDVRRLVQEQCALTFVPGPVRSVLWMFGTGGNGKGVLSRIIQRLHAVPVAMDLHQLSSPTHRAKAIGATLLTVSEVGERRPWDVSTWKALVAGDALDVRKLYSDGFTYCNTAKMIVDAQNPPYFEDKSNGAPDRLVPVRFGADIAQSDRIIGLADRIIDEELHLVADWILAGLQRVARRGGSPMPRDEWPAEVLAIWRGIQRHNDPLKDWIAEVGVVYDATLPLRPRDEIVNAWAAWAEEIGYTDASGGQRLHGLAFWNAMRRVPGFDALLAATDERCGATRKRACRIALGPEDAAHLRAKAAHEAKARAEAWSKTQVVGGSDGLPF